MFAKFRPRRSTSTEWEITNPILQEGELVVEVPDSGVGTGLCKFKIGDGYTQWNDLPYAFDANSAQSIYGGNPFISRDICLRAGTTDDWETENPVLKYGELVIDITLMALKIGDGEHTFTELEYIGYNRGMDQDYDFGDLDNPDGDD